jgi:hypothetical protein
MLADLLDALGRLVGGGDRRDDGADRPAGDLGTAMSLFLRGVRLGLDAMGAEPEEGPASIGWVAGTDALAHYRHGDRSIGLSVDRVRAELAAGGAVWLGDSAYGRRVGRAEVPLADLLVYAGAEEAVHCVQLARAEASWTDADKARLSGLPSDEQQAVIEGWADAPMAEIARRLGLRSW